MTDTATLQKRLDELKRAYASGATSVSYDGKNVSYRGLDEMRASIAALENELSGGKGVGKSMLIRSTKGW